MAELTAVAKHPPLSTVEVIRIAGDLQTLVGSQLQDCVQSGSELGLAFYHERSIVWLWFDLNPMRPVVIRSLHKPPAHKKIQRPLTLFLKARFTGRRLASVRADVDQGRVLILSFHRSQDEKEQEQPQIEARLFPHGQNVIARDGASLISERKPKDLEQVATRVSLSEQTERSWDEIEAEWRARRAGSSTRMSREAEKPIDAQGASEKAWLRAVEKKEKALEKMREDLASKTSPLWSQAGEWLKSESSEFVLGNIPDEYLSLIDKEKSLSWNIENLFRKTKDNQRKAEGTRTRIVSLEAELYELRRLGPASYVASQNRQPGGRPESLLAKASAKGRRYQIGHDLEVFVGKSAADNLAILRKAQSFDYWLHLKDYTGSHAIMRRTRGRTVTDVEFHEAGRWVIEQSLGKRTHELKGEKFDLLIVECRYVRPIKGDRLGRVNYSHDRVMTIKL
jgi:predicted ribosome quality control (RQC) complex YloA/Tae2 family protein